MARAKAKSARQVAAGGRWLLKTEPSVYGWDQMTADRRTAWDGVRNHQARNHLAAMKKGDQALYYHTDEERSAVGVVEVVAEAYPDPTADDPRWVVVDVAPVAALVRPVTLKEIKGDPALQDIALIKQGRLSVVPLSAEAFARIVELGGGLARR